MVLPHPMLVFPFFHLLRAFLVGILGGKNVGTPSTSFSFGPRRNSLGSRYSRKLGMAATSGLSASSFHSSLLTWMVTEAMFSSRCRIELVPGMSTICGDRALNQAKAT